MQLISLEAVKKLTSKLKKKLKGEVKHVSDPGKRKTDRPVIHVNRVALDLKSVMQGYLRTTVNS